MRQSCYRAIKRKPIDIKTSTQIDFDVENNDVANRARILKNKNTRS